MQSLIEGEMCEEAVVYDDGALLITKDVLEKYKYSGDASENAVIIRLKFC